MSAPLTPEQLAEIAALAQAATEGPWNPYRLQDGSVVVFGVGRTWFRLSDGAPEKRPDTLFEAQDGTAADAAFIAAARTAVPELLAEVARLQALVTEMHAAAVGETRPPLLRQLADAAATRAAFLAQKQRADTLDGIAREMAARVAELEDAAKAPAEVTVYRASHDSIVFGLYTTPNAAWKHCEAYAEREFPAPFAAYWHEDEDEDGVTELMISRHGNPDVATGYVVTPLTVAAAYDPDGDE